MLLGKSLEAVGLNSSKLGDFFSGGTPLVQTPKNVEKYVVTTLMHFEYLSCVKMRLKPERRTQRKQESKQQTQPTQLT